MTITENAHKTIPEYYPSMHLDGYTPTQIQNAMQKKLRREYAERRTQENEIDGINITGEVRVK